MRTIGYTISMEQIKNNPQNKIFRFRFSPLLLAVMIVGLALCAACIGLTSWQFADFLRGDLTSVYDWLKFFLLYFVSVFLAVLILSMLVRSQYILTEKELVLQFGFVKSRYEDFFGKGVQKIKQAHCLFRRFQNQIHGDRRPRGMVRRIRERARRAQRKNRIRFCER